MRRGKRIPRINSYPPRVKRRCMLRASNNTVMCRSLRCDPEGERSLSQSLAICCARVQQASDRELLPPWQLQPQSRSRASQRALQCEAGCLGFVVLLAPVYALFTSLTTPSKVLAVAALTIAAPPGAWGVTHQKKNPRAAESLALEIPGDVLALGLLDACAGSKPPQVSPRDGAWNGDSLDSGSGSREEAKI